MKSTLHKAASRGDANHGWLKSRHTFSFANYYDPARLQFGALRVLNDDIVAAGMGFGRHPHHNMEIISIPTYGDLRHQDSMGNETIIRQGDIQVMSAGTGITHSEMNANANREVRFFQIWVTPNKANVTPRYGQYTMNPAKLHNQLQVVLSPDENAEGVWIYQDAWFSMGNLEAGFTTNYTIKKPGNGVYAFVIEGEVTINGIVLQNRDGLAISEAHQLIVNANTNAQLLLMDIPLNP
jgi:redox-sensitive bicupin YhaK (pirin superfamily)